MSRQRKRIEKFCKEKGVIIQELTWEPIGKNMEMQGPAGGWRLIDDDLEDYFGLNVDELLSNIDLHVQLQEQEKADRDYEFWSGIGMTHISAWLKQNLERFPFLKEHNLDDPRVVPCVVMALLCQLPTHEVVFKKVEY